jgi:hypothetical protein
MKCKEFYKSSRMSCCMSFVFVELQIWLIYSATACMSRIAENAWMLGYFACMLLSVIHVFDSLSIALPCVHVLASCISSLDAPREGWDGVWWTYPEGGRTGQVLEWEMLTKWVSSNKQGIVSDPRQAPEHYKSPNFGNAIEYICYMYWCIKL